MPMKMISALRLAVLVSLMTTASLPAAAQNGPDPLQDPVSPQEIERLRRQITRESRSSAEMLGEFRHESGDVNNRLNLARYGARVNLRLPQGAIFSAGVVRTHYLSQLVPFNSSGTNFTVGLRSTASDTAAGRIELGLTTFSTGAVSVNGAGDLSRRLTERATLTIGATRTNVEESLLSAAGLRPAAGPFATQLAGVVMDNRFTGGWRYRWPADAEVLVEGGFGNRHGSNIASNAYRHFHAGAGVNLVNEPLDAAVTLLRAGYDFQYFGFSADRLGFGGVSLQNRRGQLVAPSALGADGISPLPTATRPGVGGYFSPPHFASHTGRVDIQGIAGTSVEYRISGFLGFQRYPGVEARLVNGLSAAAEFPLSERWSLPVRFHRDNFGPFTQQSIGASLRVAF
jgi:hypothetical protein